MEDNTVKCVLIKTDKTLEEVNINLSNKNNISKVLGGAPTFLGMWKRTDIVCFKLKSPDKSTPINQQRLPEPFNKEIIMGNILLVCMDDNAKYYDLHKDKVELFISIEEKDTGNNVYISGIPFKTTESKVLEYFEKCGYGHIVFKTHKGFLNALELSGTTFPDSDREIYVGKTIQKPKPEREIPSRPANCKTIFIKNIPYTITEEGIMNEFKIYGKIDRVRIPLNNITKNNKGFCYVTFVNASSAENAVNKGNININGRILYIDYDTGAPRAGFKTRDGRDYYDVFPQDKHLLKKRKLDSSNSNNNNNNKNVKKMKLNKKESKKNNDKPHQNKKKV